MHMSQFSSSLARPQFPVAEVLSAAELSFSLDLEVMNCSHSKSSPMWHYEFNCLEKTIFAQTSASGQVSAGVCF